MKILVPFNNEEKLDKFIEAGAEEFYLGFYDPKWTEKFGEYSDINRMTGFKRKANQYNFEEATNIIRTISSKNKSGFITMNANCYSYFQIDYIAKNYLPILKETGIEGIIVSDINLAEAIIEEGINAVASTMCGIYNEDIARSYLKIGMKRLIVPRDLSLDEIKDIKEAVPEAQFEVFFMRNGCIFSDCYCLGMHRSECGATCSFIRDSRKTFMTEKRSFEDRQKVDKNNLLYNEFFHRETCGMCALYRLKDIGVGSLKIVGRSDRPDYIIDDIKLIKENIAIAQNAKDEKEFLNKMKFPPNSSRKCISGLSCYYPEVRFS